MPNKINWQGMQVGKLTVLCENGRDKSGNVLWYCRCECGKELNVSCQSLKHSKVASCGCYLSTLLGKSHTTHGETHTRLYNIWHGLMRRDGKYKCASDRELATYKGRGISLCDEWHDYTKFREWALANGYRDDLEIDRRDTNKGYCPENCHWVTRKENANNCRKTLRLSDGTPLALFCSEIGIETCLCGKGTNKYCRIRSAYARQKIHPELLQALRKDVHNQARELYRVAMERQAVEIKLKQLRKKLGL